MKDLNKLKKFLKDTLKESGAIAKEYFNKNVQVDHKPDDSPVTIADKDIETLIRQRIKEGFPDYGIIGEEFEDHKPDAKVKFVIDPIDGTKAFINNIPTFGIMIGVLELGQPVLGGVYQPISDEMWVGDNKSTTKNDVIVRTNKNEKISKATVTTTAYEYLSANGNKFFKSVSKRAKKELIGGDCYNYCKLAEGANDIVIEEGLKFHDYIPLIPILIGASATCSDFNGAEISHPYPDKLDELLVCSSKALQEAVIDIVKKQDVS